MEHPVLIIGGGLAGLAAARTLHAAGVAFELWEAESHLGGKLRTDVIDGFRCDAGFQVVFDAYPTLGQFVEMDSMGQEPFLFGTFETGARVFDGSRLRLVHARRPIATLLDGWLPVPDLLRLLRWSVAARTHRNAKADSSAEAFLTAFGFSQLSLQRFLRPFLGGIFLDSGLSFSAVQLNFVWSMLSAGDTELPGLGIGQLADAIAQPLPAPAVHLGRAAMSITLGPDGRVVAVSDGTITQRVERLILATPTGAAFSLLGHEAPDVPSRSSICLYFETPTPPVTEPIIVLNGTGSGIVNEVVPVSEVCPLCAPPGRHLVSATIIGDRLGSDSELAEQVKAELAAWFPTSEVATWRLICVRRVPSAQLEQLPNFWKSRIVPPNLPPNLYLAGEMMTHSSIEGALQSGVRAANSVIKSGAGRGAF